MKLVNGSQHHLINVIERRPIRNDGKVWSYFWAIIANGH